MFCAEEIDRSQRIAASYGRPGQLLVGASDADDLAQDAFLRSVGGIRSVKNAVKYSLVKQYRMKANKGSFRLCDLVNYSYDHTIGLYSDTEISCKAKHEKTHRYNCVRNPYKNTTPLDELISKELWEFVETLPPEIASVIELRYRCGYTIYEVADMLDLSVAQVMRRSKSGIESLGRIYDEGKEEFSCCAE